MYKRTLNFQLDKILSQYFEFDCVFNLLKYDRNLDLLYRDLELLVKPEYQTNYRFIFYHWDTDYYITNDQPGLLLRNLQKILFELDISNFFSLIITQQDISTQLEQLRIEETVDDFAISSIVTMLQPEIIFPAEKNNNIDLELIEKTYLSLNSVRRFHRTLLYSYLKDKNLLDRGFVSYAAKK